jgi:sugar O-acyltransferase (sialic acid O-acetyltransferase NeuD family)
VKRLLIIGAGGHGKVVADAALASGWDTVAFLDDRGAAAGAPLGFPVLGPCEELAVHRDRFPAAAVAVGRAARRLELLDRCRAEGFELPVIVHPRASVSRFASLEAGCVVFAQAAVNASARLGVGCIVNTGATVDHDCTLGSGCHVCPGAHLAGTVVAGDRVWFGIGSAVRQGVSIGRDVMIAAGAVVVSDVPDATTVMGVPARQVR